MKKGETMYFEGELFRNTDFYFRCLSEQDLEKSNYLQWMRDSISNPFIEAVDPLYSLTSLKSYLNNINSSVNAISIGFFDIHTDKHIGNIKFHDIDSINKTSWLGILIGDELFRGKSKGELIIRDSVTWIEQKFSVNIFYLGVTKKNLPAIKCYLKSGFIIKDENSDDAKYTMIKAV